MRSFCSQPFVVGSNNFVECVLLRGMIKTINRESFVNCFSCLQDSFCRGREKTPQYLWYSTAISSIRIIMSTKCTLYEHINYQGSSRTFDEAISNLKGHGFNDKASSANVVGRPWIFYQHVDFKGNAQVVKPGDYPTYSSWAALMMTSLPYVPYPVNLKETLWLLSLSTSTMVVECLFLPPPSLIFIAAASTTLQALWSSWRVLGRFTSTSIMWNRLEHTLLDRMFHTWHPTMQCLQWR